MPEASPITYLVSSKFEIMALSRNIAELESDTSGGSKSGRQRSLLLRVNQVQTATVTDTSDESSADGNGD